MIAAPLNDQTCLGHITDTVRELVQKQDPAFVSLAEQVGTTEGLAAHLQAQPQRDDTGDPADGPREDACAPSQRVRLSPIPPDPNCVERAAIYVGVAELIDPEPVRQLKTAMTPGGLHTYPVENRTAVRLDPAIPRNALQADLFRSLPMGVEFELPDAIAWLLDIAEEPAARVIGGLARVRAAAQAIDALLAGVYLDDREIDDIAYTCALALREARAFGAVGIALVRETVRRLGARLPRYAHPIVGPAAPALELGRRNATALKIGKYTITPNWDLLGRLGRVGLNVGTDVGLAALQMKLASMGLSPPVMSVIEHELNREGVTLGRFAPQAPSLAALALLPKLGKKSSTAPAATAARATPAASSLAAPAAARELRNAWVATPGLILSEMNLTNQDILALGRDIRASFRRPFEAQLAAAEARFEKEYGRVPGAGISSKGPGDHGVGLSPEKDADGRHKRVTLTEANAFISSEQDYAKVHSWMSPAPTAADLQWMSYQGNFVHNWGEFEREWQAWYAEHTRWRDRLWGSVRDTALDYRERAKKWREQFLQLGGIANAPAPQMPTQPDFFGSVGPSLKTAALVAGGVVGAAILLPPLLRRS
jgi:hypothetical protein